MAFNEAQKRAIRHTDGPALVLAGPGSGKTTVITNRVRYLTEKVGVEPGNILVITFTRAAAREMKERYERMQQSLFWDLPFCLFYDIKTGIPVSGLQYRKRRAAHPVYQGAVRPDRSGDRGRRRVYFFCIVRDQPY